MRLNLNPVWDFVKSKTIGNQFRTFRPEEDNDKILNSLLLAEQLMPNKTLVVCERSEHPMIHYVSKNCASILGYPAEEFAAKSIQEFFELVHPDDSKNVLQCYEYINNSEPYNPASFRFETYYRLRTKDGSYIYIIDEKLAIETEGQKFIYIAAFQNVKVEKFQQVKLHIHKMMAGEFRRISSYYPRNENDTITPRQQEVIELISKGLSNKEIASRLNISLNTIKNHKYSIFKKANVKSSAQLTSTLLHAGPTG
jgi:PAS domain S-box-containing protein